MQLIETVDGGDVHSIANSYRLGLVLRPSWQSESHNVRVQEGVVSLPCLALLWECSQSSRQVFAFCRLCAALSFNPGLWNLHTWNMGAKSRRKPRGQWQKSLLSNLHSFSCGPDYLGSTVYSFILLQKQFLIECPCRLRASHKAVALGLKIWLWKRSTGAPGLSSGVPHGALLLCRWNMWHWRMYSIHDLKFLLAFVVWWHLETCF